MKKSKVDEVLGGDRRVYELGFIFVPTIAEEKIAGVYETLKKNLTGHGAEIIAEESPAIRPLAYEMIKVIANKNNRFSQGYFGWVKFEMDADNADALKKELDINLEIIRYMLTKTVRENTMYSKRPAREVKSRDREEGLTSLGRQEKPEENSAVAPETAAVA